MPDVSDVLRSRGQLPPLDRARPPAPIPTAESLAGAWASILGLVDPDSPRIVVDDHNVRGLPALERATNLVANNVAAMFVAATRGAAEAVLRRPHPLLGPFEYYAMIVRTAIRRGNFVAVVAPGATPGDAQLVPVHPDLVSVDSSTGLPVYTINNRVYSWREVFHVRANVEPGTWWGLGVVEKFRTPLSEHLHAQRYAETTYRTGGVPAGVVTIEQNGPVSEDQTNTVNESWQTKFGHGQRKVAVLPKGLSFQPVAWSPHDAEFAEARRISVAEAALMIGLRPEDLGASFGGTGLTYGNRTADAIQRIIDSYQPWVEILESPLTDLVGRQVDADPVALLKLTPLEAAQLEAAQLENDARRRNLNNPNRQHDLETGDDQP